MGGSRKNGIDDVEERSRWVFYYTVSGDLRFISHHDTLRLFRRALVRAKLPVRWSEGFNPHPRIMIPLPRPVGIASDAEAIVVATDGPVDSEDAVQRLEHHTPADLRMIAARNLKPGEKIEPVLVRYSVEPADSPISNLHARARDLLEADTVQVNRTNPKKARTVLVDLRPYIVDINLEGEEVEFTLRVTNNGTARPAEIADLLGYQADAINHRIRRLEIKWR